MHFISQFKVCLLLSSLILLMSSCSSNTTQVNYEDLSGRWDIIHASRDGKLTHTLENLYFSFGVVGTMEHNLLGNPKMFEIEIEGDKIIQKGTDPMIHKIESLTDQMLVLSTDIQEMHFVFELQRN